MEEEVRNESSPAEGEEKTPEAETEREATKTKPAGAQSPDKLAAKAKLRELKVQRQETLENEDHDRLKEIRKHMKKIKRKLRKAPFSSQ